MPLTTALHERIALAPDRPCVTVLESTGDSLELTNAAFGERVQCLAADLRATGVSPGCRCVIVADNGFDFLLFFWALQEVGAVVVPVIPGLAPEELAFVVEKTDVTAIFTTECHEARVSGIVARSETARRDAAEGDAPPVYTLDSLRAAVTARSHKRGHNRLPAASTRCPGEKRDGAVLGTGDTLAVLMYTSGSSGRPKGVMLTDRALGFCAKSIARHLRLDTSDRVLTCLPLFHINALCLQMLATMVSGATLVLTPKFSASRYWSWVSDYRITVAHLLAGPIRILLAEDSTIGDNDLRVVTFGLPLEDQEIVAFEQRVGAQLCMAWGMTESCGGATMTPLDEPRRTGHQVVGKELEGWEVRVVDGAGLELPTGEVGELTIGSDATMHGYFRDRAATEATLRGGWLYTGDLGFKDAEGYVHFVDRKKDMLKPFGENVAAAEVERIIDACPAVLECAVVGVPDPIRGERIVAYVVPDRRGTIVADSVIQWCAQHLASFKVPSRVELVDALPKTSIGKVEKRTLRQLAAAANVATGETSGVTATSGSELSGRTAN